MDTKFKIGDVVYVSGNVRHKDEIGEVVDLSRNADFVVVKLYSDNTKKSFHASDLSIETDDNGKEDKRDDDMEIYVAFYNEDDHVGWVGKLRRSEEDGRTKWREIRLKDEKTDKDWGHITYMSYLSPKDLMTWIEKDYGRHYDIRGPFESRAEAREYMKKKFMLDESVITEAVKFKAGDAVHMGYATKTGSGVDGILDKIEGEYAYVKVKKGNKEQIVKGHAAYLSKSISEGYVKTADWKDKGVSYKRWDFDHDDGSKTDRHQSTIEMKKDAAGNETYTAHHRIEKGYWTDQSKKGPQVKVTYKSTHSSFGDAKAALTAHTDKFYSKKLEGLEDLDLATCDLLEAWVTIEQLYEREEALLIFEALKEVRSQFSEGYGEDNKDFQAWIKAVRKKHPNATLTGTEHQAQMIDWNTKNNKLCGEWDGKKGIVLEAGPFSYSSKNKPPRKGTLAAELLARKKKEDKNLGNFEIDHDMIGTAKRIKHTKDRVVEQEMLARMLKHVSDKRNFNNPPSKVDLVAISDTKKMTAGKKKSYAGIKFKNNASLMSDLLDRALAVKRKQKIQANKYNELTKAENKGNTPMTKVDIKKYQDYLRHGIPVKGGRPVGGIGPSSYSDEGDGDGGGVGESYVAEADAKNSAKDVVFNKFYNFLHHMAEEEFPACKVIHIEPCDKFECIEVHVECRDDPRSKGLQKDLTEKLQHRLNKHPIPGLEGLRCKVIHNNPKPDKIAN